MTLIRKLAIEGQDVLGTVQGFLRSLLNQEEIAAVLAPRRLFRKSVVMPALITDSDGLRDVDPLAPAFFLNAATLAARLTRRPSGRKMAIVLRPCEIRAFIELVKFRQGTMDDILLIGLDCLGAYPNTVYRRLAADPESATLKFFFAALSGAAEAFEGAALAPACRVCEHPFPDGADIALNFIGLSPLDYLLVQGQTPKAEAYLKHPEFQPAEIPASRDEAVSALISARVQARDAMIRQTHEATDTPEKLSDYLSGCVNCYNCRNACPICYCRECVFCTDAFDREPFQYLQRAERSGAIKLPMDTVMYHLTRLTHMSTSCVGCGQCSNACPNDIPVMELFRATAHFTQKAFGYEAGRSVSEPPPLSVFQEQEFTDIVGLKRRSGGAPSGGNAS